MAKPRVRLTVEQQRWLRAKIRRLGPTLRRLSPARRQALDQMLDAVLEDDDDAHTPRTRIDLTTVAEALDALSQDTPPVHPSPAPRRRQKER